MVSVSRPSQEAPLPGSVCTSTGRARTRGSELEAGVSRLPASILPLPPGGVRPEGRMLLMGKWPGAVPGTFQKGQRGPRCSTCVQTCPQPLGPQGEGEAP